MANIWKILTRKKIIEPAAAEETRLSRVLNTFDLTALGVGSTLGVGVYVLAGHVAKDTAGPAVILSFLIAAIASVFAGLCYAEFGARAPKAGSAYIYSYVCVGEFVAFVIGWNLILEYVIGSASVARGLSSYIDTLVNDTMQNTFIEIAPISIPYLSKYFDFFAFGISIILAVALAFGLKESSLANNIFTIINIFVVLFVIIAGSLKANPENWRIQPDHNSTNSTYNIGNGGFFPFGIEGVIKGAATCFYGFVGFDCIATTGEEVKNPKKAIPIAIILSLLIIFLAYFGTSTVVTLMVPYYLQDPNAPIPYAFEHVGWYTAKWIVSIGGIFGLCASLFGAMFPLPRIIYAMANDSLVFRFLGRVSSRFETPVIGTLLAGLLTGLMAAMFELKQLVNMMSIGTLLAYTIVAVSILLLRYSENQFPLNSKEDVSASDEQELLDDLETSSVIGQIFNCGRHKNPTKISMMIVSVEVAIYCLMCIFIGLSAMYLKNPIINGEIWAIVLTSVVVLIAVILIISMVTQPKQNGELSFKVPMVPLIPALSILVNIYLMLMLDAHTWVRFGVWMAIGLPIYYFSVRPYKEAQNNKVLNKNSIDPTVSMVNTPTQNGKLNGVNTIAFVADDISEKKDSAFVIKESQKRPAPQPPTSVNDIEIPPEITKLDEILEEVSNSIDRKLSIGTVSNVSDVVSREENVIAVVHRDNVITPANSNAPPSPTDSKQKFSTDIGTISSLGTKNDTQYINFSNSEIVSEKIAENETQKEALNKLPNGQQAVNFPLPPELFSSISLEDSDKIAENETQKEVLTKLPDQQETVKSSLPPEPFSSNSLEDTIDSDENKASNETSAVSSTETVSSIVTPPPSPSTVSPSKENKNNVPMPVPPPFPLPNEEIKKLPKEESYVAPRPTSANLNSVRLRPLKQKENLKEDKKSYEPDDDNLKVGSDKYKSFLESLNGKLQKLSVLPTYFPYISKNVNKGEIKKEERKKNENVIEDSIDQKEAREKLSKIDGFLTRNLVDEFSRESDKGVPKESRIENIDTPNEVKESAEELDEDSDYINHKKRMQNVFRSINLKKSDSFKGSVAEENQRNAKSLGSSFLTDDKSRHRQAMSDIFKLIELKRKDSKKLNENKE